MWIDLPSQVSHEDARRLGNRFRGGWVLGGLELRKRGASLQLAAKRPRRARIYVMPLLDQGMVRAPNPDRLITRDTIPVDVVGKALAELGPPEGMSALQSLNWDWWAADDAPDFLIEQARAQEFALIRVGTDGSLWKREVTLAALGEPARASTPAR